MEEKEKISIDLRNLTQEQIKYFEELIEKCDSCKETQEECMKKTMGITEFIKKGNETTNKIWVEQPKLRPCIAFVILEQIEKGLL